MTTTSADGTKIAYEVHGDSGPTVVLVDGALCSRQMGPSPDLAKALAADFRVHIYDRRDRGESDAGATPFHPDREVEDLAAVIDAAGGSAHLFGSSSGAFIALAAAQADVGVDRIVLYEAPPAVDRSIVEQVREAGRGEAVKLFMRAVGVPAPFVGLMRVTPVWKKLTATAHTLPYDLTLVADQQLPTDVANDTLVIVGGKSPARMRDNQEAIADALPNGTLETLAGQTHMIKAKATAPVVSRFFA